jgi:hypothetical protein
MNKISPLRITLATVAVALCAGLVLAAPIGYSYLYGNGYTNPNTTLAGYLATADGGVVTVLGSPKPTAVGQALRSTTTGTAMTAGFVSDPAATTTAAGVSQFDTALPKINGVPRAGSSGRAMQSDAVMPPIESALTLYFHTYGGVNNYLNQSISGTNAEKSTTLTATPALLWTYVSDPGVYLVPGLPGSGVWPKGTYELILWLRSTSAATVTVTEATLGAFPSISVPGDNVQRAYTVYLQTTTDTIVSPPTTPYSLAIVASAGSGSGTLNLGTAGAYASRFSPPNVEPTTYYDYRMSNDRVASGLRSNDSSIVDTHNASPPTAGQCFCASSSTQGAWMNVSTATGTSIALDTSAAQDITAGPAIAGANGKASDSGHKHHVGSNSPQQGWQPYGSSDTTTSTSTSVSTVSNIVWGPPSTGTGLGTSTQGAVLYNGSTATGTNTSSSPVWGAPPAAGPPLSTSIPPSFGNFGNTGQVGTSTSAMRADAIAPLPPLPVASTVFQGICNYGSTSGTCVQGNDPRLGAFANRAVYSANLSGTVTVSSDSWTSVLSVSTSGNGGRIIAYGAITLTSTTASRCDARIVLDNYASGDGPALKGVTDSNVQASLSPIFTTTFPAGSHTVNLQVLNFNSINCQATIGYQYEIFGSLIVQEFTN